MFSSPEIRSQFFVSLWPWAVTFLVLLYLQSILIGEAGRLERARAGYFISIKSVRLWEKQSCLHFGKIITLEGRPLFKRTVALGVFEDVYFSPYSGLN